MSRRSEYLAQVRAMFDAAQEQIEDIGRQFIVEMATDLTLNVPGPNNQYPPDTEYIATGRLRGSLQFALDAPATASRMDGGPYDEDGSDTIAKVAFAVYGFPLPKESVLYYDVGYAWYVHEGEGNHSAPRPWTSEAADRADLHAVAATRKVMSGAEG